MLQDAIGVVGPGWLGGSFRPPGSVMMRMQQVRVWTVDAEPPLSSAPRGKNKSRLPSRLGLRTRFLPMCSGEAGEHARVERVCQEGLARQPEEVIRQILKYEIALAEQQDNICHTVEEALAHE